MTIRAWLAAALFVATSASAAPCLDNFTAEGNFLTGKTYKTWAQLPGVRKQEAFARAYAFTVENGFTVLSADKEVGVISAAQSVSYGNGKTVPLNIVVADAEAGARIALSYATPGGVSSPEDAIKKHFCLTVGAAGEGSKSPPQESAGQQAGTGVVAAPARRTLPGYATSTQDQRQAIARELPKNVPNEKLRELVREASPTISAYLERVSCLNHASGISALGEFAAPGVFFGGGPVMRTQYHNKAICMSVFRIHGWTMPAANAIQFEVVYKADDSGETSTSSYEAVRQPDGAWLFTR